MRWIKKNSKNILNKYDNNFVNVDWEDSMMPCIKNLEHCLVYK